MERCQGALWLLVLLGSRLGLSWRLRVSRRPGPGECRAVQCQCRCYSELRPAYNGGSGPGPNSSFKFHHDAARDHHCYFIRNLGPTVPYHDYITYDLRSSFTICDIICDITWSRDYDIIVTLCHRFSNSFYDIIDSMTQISHILWYVSFCYIIVYDTVCDIIESMLSSWYTHISYIISHIMGTGAFPAFSLACILAWIHPATAQSLLSLYRPQSAAGSILRLNQCGDSVKAWARLGLECCG